MPECECASYGHLEQNRKSINRRIRDTRSIKQRLSMVAQHPDGEHILLRCGVCGQLWQSSRAWNWGNKEYVFRVPDISEADWLAEPFVSPDELLIYMASMDDFLERNDFRESTTVCRVEGCQNNAVQGLVTCLEHHIASLQRVHALPARPGGRRFPPYTGEDEQNGT